MFTRLGHFTVRRRRYVLVRSVIGLVLAAILGSGVFDRLLSGGFDDPDSESTIAEELLEREFGTGAPDIVLIITATDGDVNAPEVVAEGLTITSELDSMTGTDEVVSYWSLGSAPCSTR